MSRIVTESPEAWRQAALDLASGQPVIVPTDTVYGFCCDPYNREAIGRVFEAKGRDRTKALPLLVDSYESLAIVSSGLPVLVAKLGSRFWPGPLTLVVPKHPGLPEELGSATTIAVRIPNHGPLLAFIKSLGGAIAATSANVSGEREALNAQQASDALGRHVALIIDGGIAPGGVASTVVDCSVEPPVILRPGPLYLEVQGLLR